MLRATRAEIALDLELDFAAREGGEARQCVRCDGWTYRPTCPCSPAEEFREQRDGKVAGEGLADLEARAQAGDDSAWEEYERRIYGKRVGAAPAAQPAVPATDAAESLRR